MLLHAFLTMSAMSVLLCLCFLTLFLSYSVVLLAILLCITCANNLLLLLFDQLLFIELPLYTINRFNIYQLIKITKHHKNLFLCDLHSIAGIVSYVSIVSLLDSIFGLLCVSVNTLLTALFNCLLH